MEERAFSDRCPGRHGPFATIGEISLCGIYLRTLSLTPKSSVTYVHSQIHENLDLLKPGMPCDVYGDEVQWGPSHTCKANDNFLICLTTGS